MYTWVGSHIALPYRPTSTRSQNAHARLTTLTGRQPLTAPVDAWSCGPWSARSGSRATAHVDDIRSQTLGSVEMHQTRGYASEAELMVSGRAEKSVTLMSCSFTLQHKGSHGLRRSRPGATMVDDVVKSSHPHRSPCVPSERLQPCD